MKLYTTTTCPKCILVKGTLEAAGIEAEIINMDENLEARQHIKDMGFLAAPVMEEAGSYTADIPGMMEMISVVAEHKQ